MWKAGSKIPIVYLVTRMREWTRQSPVIRQCKTSRGASLSSSSLRERFGRRQPPAEWSPCIPYNAYQNATMLFFSTNNE